MSKEFLNYGHNWSSWTLYGHNLDTFWVWTLFGCILVTIMVTFCQNVSKMRPSLHPAPAPKKNQNRKNPNCGPSNYAGQIIARRGFQVTLRYYFDLKSATPRSFATDSSTSARARRVVNSQLRWHFCDTQWWMIRRDGSGLEVGEQKCTYCTDARAHALVHCTHHILFARRRLRG